MGYRFWRLMGEMVETATTYGALAGVAAPSPYTPDVDATLIAIRVISTGQAASSLVNSAQIRLTCTTFTPNTIHVVTHGCGLRTAPANVPIPIDYPVSQPTKAGVPITLEGRHPYTNAVTPDILVLGLFEI
jgi:hypothetical protein